MISVGRSAYTEGLDLDKVGITTDKYGRVEVDVNLKQTYITYMQLVMLLKV